MASSAQLAGIDWSSTQIDVCILPLDVTDKTMPTFRNRTLPKTERERATPPIIRNLLRPLAQWDTTEPEVGRVVSVWVEEAWGSYHGATRVLLPIYGAILASIPTDIATASMSAREWRKHLALPQKKDKALMVTTARDWWSHLGYGEREWTDHEAEALLIALAGRDITWTHHVRVSA